MPSFNPLGFVVMGVSGSGKTTLGKALAQKLGWDFYDADDFHLPENVAKMTNGIPLDDSDRAPWLASLHDQLLYTLNKDRHPVLACSALKESYRAQLINDLNRIVLIYLRGSYEIIRSRMLSREDHYMKPEMLKGQFDILEEPQDAFVLDVSMTLGEMLSITINRFFPEKR
ncbi:MAG TPA: gluconokinase [Anaerolineales bacterium]|nr:gluconokinase [Anaerolineales bacterium]